MIGDILFEDYMREQKADWDSAMARVRRLLNADIPTVRALTYRLLSVNSMTLFYALGGEWYGRGGAVGEHVYAFPESVYDLLEFVSFLVGYEILDDGEPAIGYYVLGENGRPALCSPETEDSKPFFHRSHEILADFCSWEVEHLSCRQALRILNAYERARAAKFHGARSASMREAYEMTTRDREIAALARENMLKGD